MTNDKLAEDVIESMRLGGMSEASADGFWIGIQLSQRHPEWVRALWESYEREVIPDHLRSALEMTNGLADALVSAHPLETS